MKILKIFGIVVAIHAFAFVLIFANPGCSSTNKAAPSATAPTAAPTRPTVVSYTPPAADAPVITASPAGGFDPNAPAISGPVRYSPTRPGTPAATAVQVQPVADVVPATTYTVATGDSLWTVAKKNHLTVAELSAANNLTAASKLKLGQKLIIPSKSMAAPASAGAAGGGVPTYKVKAGDKLSVIAKRAGTTVAVLKDLNSLKSDVVRPGQDLKLPAGAVVADAVPVDAAAVMAKPSSDSFVHVVKSGESLSTIARKYEMKQGEIAVANNISNPALIKAGMTLVIPGWKAPKSAQGTEDTAAPKMLSPDSGPATTTKPVTQADIPVIKIEDSSNSSKRP